MVKALEEVSWQLMVLDLSYVISSQNPAIRYQELIMANLSGDYVKFATCTVIEPFTMNNETALDPVLYLLQHTNS